MKDIIFTVDYATPREFVLSNDDPDFLLDIDVISDAYLLSFFEGDIEDECRGDAIGSMTIRVFPDSAAWDMSYRDFAIFCDDESEELGYFSYVLQEEIEADQERWSNGMDFERLLNVPVSDVYIEDFNIEVPGTESMILNRLNAIVATISRTTLRSALFYPAVLTNEGILVEEGEQYDSLVKTFEESGYWKSNFGNMLVKFYKAPTR